MNEQETEAKRAMLKKVTEALPDQANNEQISMIISWILTNYGATLEEVHSILIHVANHQRQIEELNKIAREKPVIN